MDIRPITDDEVPLFRQAMMATFGGDPVADPQGDDRFRSLVDCQRAFAAFDRGVVVATAAAFDFSLTVPGGALPMAGLTMVSVRPTHRRRGILRALMGAHLDDARAHGAPVSGLWASEAAIYGRFGYGLAAEGEDLSLTTPGLELARGPADDVEPLDDTAPEALPAVYDAVRATRPGMITRSEPWWRYRRFADRPDIARGASPRRHVLARRDGVATGYVTYRLRLAWEQGVAAGAVEIEEMVTTDARAEATLWRFVTAVDLFPKVSWWNCPVDTILPWIASDPRRVRRRRSDTIWLRLDDVAAALCARSYATDGSLLLEVVDPPAAQGNVYELAVRDGAARCVRADGPADLRLDRAGLGSLFLGCAGATLLARAGRATGEPGALALADRMLATSIVPWCAEIF